MVTCQLRFPHQPPLPSFPPSPPPPLPPPLRPGRDRLSSIESDVNARLAAATAHWHDRGTTVDERLAQLQALTQRLDTATDEQSQALERLDRAVHDLDEREAGTQRLARRLEAEAGHHRQQLDSELLAMQESVQQGSSLLIPQLNGPIAVHCLAAPVRPRMRLFLATHACRGVRSTQQQPH